MKEILKGPRGALLGSALEAVHAAARLCRRVQNELVTDDTYTKKDRSPVTVADFAAQAVVSARLAAADSRIPIVGEETAGVLRTDEGRDLKRHVVEHAQFVLRPRGSADPDGSIVPAEAILDAIDACSGAGGPSGLHWVLDPIDGTKGYLRKQQYAVALALLEDGAPVLGVLGCPAMPRSIHTEDRGRSGSGCLFFARKGFGAFQMSLEDHPLDSDQLLRAATDSLPITVTDVADPRDAVFCESVEAAHSSHDRHSAIASALGVEKTPFRIDSQCKYGAVARGQASLYLRLPTSETYREKIWDHAAGWSVLTEAGGRVSDVEGRDLDFSLGRTLNDNRGVVATNKRLHDLVLDAIRTTAG